MYTEKSDWINNYLADNDYYVSDHPSYSDKLKLTKGAKVSLRFFGNISCGYYFILVINAPRDEWTNCMTDELDQHLNVLNTISLNSIPLLLFSDNDSNKFGILRSDKSKSLLNDQELEKFFGSYDKRFLDNVGGSKRKNKTHNDSFQTWTADHLSRFMVVNDIDAFSFSKLDANSADDAYQFNIIELKRPQRESCLDWLPYTADKGNYRAGEWIQSNFKNTKFRTMAYNKDLNLTMSFFDIQSITENTISGFEFRGSIEDVDLRNLQPTKSLQPFTSNR